jgi:hypothetical protein
MIHCYVRCQHGGETKIALRSRRKEDAPCPFSRLREKVGMRVFFFFLPPNGSLKEEKDPHPALSRERERGKEK